MKGNEIMNADAYTMEYKNRSETKISELFDSFDLKYMCLCVFVL